MFVLRLFLFIGGLALLASLLLWVITRERFYLRWFFRILQLVLILLLVLLGALFTGRLRGFL
ncbi:hypothetical protein [Thiohalorhabdus methylotrophus]|uniref:Uncharacterized protein n=1 Tax=Thiohalorhabdus methylotrophus TaxID=3242694 RepID=A0ABV4TXU5_9GAMM